MLHFYTTGTKEKTTWWYVGKAECSVCGKEIDQTVAAVVFHYKNNGEHEHDIAHMTCSTSIKNRVGVKQQDIFQVFLSDNIPPGSIPRFPQPHNLIPMKTDVTVFDVQKLPSETTKDDAWRSKTYPSLEGAQIGDPLALEKIEEDLDDRQKLLDSDPDAFLKDLKSSGQRSIEQKNKRMIE